MRRIVAFVIRDADPAVEWSEDLLVFMIGLLAVNAEGDQNLNIPIGYALAVQALHQQGKIDFTAGVSGNVRGDDQHLFSRLEQGDGRLTGVKCRVD